MSAVAALFNFLMGVVYDQGSSGKYYVDKRPGVVLTGLSPEELANPAANNLTSRYYVTSQYVRHPNLSTIQYSNFFNLCRMKGVSFDLQVPNPPPPCCLCSAGPAPKSSLGWPGSLCSLV